MSMLKAVTKSRLVGTRNDRGSVIAEGVVALGMLVFGGICAVLLMLNSGLSMYHKSKLGFVAMQTATYAASLSSHDSDAVQHFATALLNRMAIGARDTTVHVEDVDIEGREGVQVAITTKLPLFDTKIDILPGSIVLRDSAVATKLSLGGEGWLKFPARQGTWNPGTINGPAYITYTGGNLWIPFARFTAGQGGSAPGPGPVYEGVGVLAAPTVMTNTWQDVRQQPGPQN